MGRLDGKVALITGGARGQGASEARLFASEGAVVHLTDVRTEGAAVADEIGGVFHEHDVTDPARWEAIAKEIVTGYGRIDVLVNNAGIFQVAGLADTDIDLWNRIIAVNQTGVFLGLKSVSPTMVEQGSGSIINISSIAGLRGAAVAFAYATSKWAVRGMTRSLAGELAPHGVRVNSIHPGIIDTPMAAEFGAELRELVDTQIPMGREASADEVAGLALFLASDDSEYCTGSEFVVDGGMTA